MSLPDNKITDVQSTMEAAMEAFAIYKLVPLRKRAALLRRIAVEIELLGNDLIEICMAETHLTEARLKGERARTIFQLNSYADACEQGNWLEASIDTADVSRTPPRADLRKMMVPLGPVVVFGAGNFPFAYSTAGGDTASALAAGCTVVVKGHDAHSKTSLLVAGAVKKALTACNLPEGVFSHLPGSGNAVGQALAVHPHTRAIGFTGSFAGGKAIWELANQRTVPIPVFAEMSSINPVFLLPAQLQQNPGGLAKQLAASVTLGCGQFCTNPGLIIGIESEALSVFIHTIGNEIHNTLPAPMLHSGIAANFRENRSRVTSEDGVSVIAESATIANATDDMPTVAITKAAVFLANKAVHTEVFGSFTLIVVCQDAAEMQNVATVLEGQLTATLMATPADIGEQHVLVETIKDKCGRLILNNVPTGVEVCLSMQHGGPWPSTTDSRFTSVGGDSIKRFARPLCFQNWPDALLPDELKNANPCNLFRTVNNELTQSPIPS